MTDRTRGKLKMLDWLEERVKSRLEVPELGDTESSCGEIKALEETLDDITVMRMIVEQSIPKPGKYSGKDLPQTGWDMGGPYDAN